MDSLKIDATRNSPEVILNPKDNIFRIKGISHPENVRKFYAPVVEWLLSYLKEIEGKTDQSIEFHLNYNYVDSSSYKYLIELMKIFRAYLDAGVAIEIVWFYEEDDEDMKYTGIELFELSEFKLPYKVVRIPNK